MIRHETRGVPASVRPVVMIVVLAAVAFAGAPGTRASGVQCGSTILADVTLDQDLACASGGLIVGADHIKINLQGHSITGTGAGAGITVIGRTDVTIFGGTIDGFFTGVLINASSNVVVKDSVLRANVDGVDAQAGSSGVTIKANDFIANTTRGIMLRGGVSAADVKNNTFTGNRVGILLFGPTSTTVKDNTLSGSTLAAIRVNFPATGNLVLANTIFSNPAGIEFLAGASGGAAGNEFVDNTIAANVCGIKGPGAANTFKDNHLNGNTSDFCS